MVDSPSQTASRVGVEITGTALNAVVIDANDAIVKTVAVELDDAGATVAKLATRIDRLKSEYPGVERLGGTVAGLVDRASGRVAFSANLPEYAEVDLATNIRAAIKMDVVIENDANAAAYGEFCCGAGRGSRDLFYATLGEGVGGAFIFHGEIWRGASGFAGEFGYVPIDSEGTRLEDVASAANIVRRTRSRFQQDGTSSLGKLAEEAIGLNEIISAAEGKDDFARMMLQRTGMYVGTAIASVINVLNIEKIVVGGEIMRARHLVLKAISERAKELSFAPSFESTTIVEGELGANAAAVGAAFISEPTG